MTTTTSHNGQSNGTANASPLRVIGVPGLSLWRGQVYEEEHPDLRGLAKRLRIYREMTTDGVIGALLDAIKWPLLAAEFDVQPGGESPADEEARDFLWSVINDMGHTWRQHVEEAMETIAFGFGCFEMVFKVREAGQSDNPDDRIGLSSLIPLGQETIANALTPWEVDREGNVLQVSQRDPQTGQIYTIPGGKLLHFTIGSRKRNPEGQSLLRALWRDWRFRRNFEELEGIGVERDVGGMPVVYPPREPTDAESQTLQKQFGSMRQDEEAVVIMPGPQAAGDTQGWTLEAYGGGTRSYNVREIIRDYDARILERGFAQFLRLGQSNVGTQALVKGSHDFFGLLLEGIQQVYLEVWNGQLVPLLFELNEGRFNGMSALPQITWETPGKADLQALMDLYQRAVDSRVLTVTEVDEDHVRGVAGLPDRPEGVGEGSRESIPQFPPFGPPAASTEPAEGEEEEEDEEDTEDAEEEEAAQFAAGDPGSRGGRGRLERATNAYQEELLSIYDAWSSQARRAIRNAQRDGLDPARQGAILDAMLGDLEFDLRNAGRRNLLNAAQESLRGPLAQHQGSPAVLQAVAKRVTDNDAFIKNNLLPDLRGRLMTDLMEGVAADDVALRGAFERLRQRPASYSGGYWAMAFEAEQAAGTTENQERAALGLAPIPVKWVLDPTAQHCAASPGFYGCPDLAGTYERGFESLPTVPAGDVTCRFRCRCEILADFGNGWERIT